MKNHCLLAVSLALSVASCAAQSDVQPAQPAREAVGGSPAEPAHPVKPAKPAKPTPADAAFQEDSARQVQAASEQLKKLQMLWQDRFVAEPFGDRDELGRTLVLSRDGHEAKNEGETEEDLNVMARILEKASISHDERAARVMGIFYRSPFGGSAAPVRNMYLEGYGAIFFLNVNYSLTPPPVQMDQKPAPKEDQDTEWESARRELEEPRGTHTEFNHEPKAAAPAPNTAPSYDPEKVETLQKDLAQALRNAAHIRELKSGETVTVIVTGRGASGIRKGGRLHRGGPDASGRESAGAVAQQRLILRAKQADIEAFQKDKMSLEEFRKRLAVSLS